MTGGNTDGTIPLHDRLTGTRLGLASQGLSALAVTKMENVRYLSGFAGSSAVAIITSDRSVLVTDGRYREQAGAQSPSWEVVIYSTNLFESVAGVLSGASEVGLETTASYEFHSGLADALDRSAVVKPTRNIIEELRKIKDAGEIGSIRAALHCAMVAFDDVAPLIKPGITERSLSAELDYRMMMAGADGPSFDTVVASGPNSSMPHAGITDRALRDGDLVVVDFGARKDGYCSDTTRTLVVGTPSDRQSELMEAVKGAQSAALEALAPGALASDIDGVARAFLEERGLGVAFSHGLGHGVGLEVHEMPTLSSRSKDTLVPGMVFTVEPGAYIPGWGGARFEDLALITSGGHEDLSVPGVAPTPPD
jgi:Xaa-Pro aminopeptidase